MLGEAGRFRPSFMRLFALAVVFLGAHVVQAQALFPFAQRDTVLMRGQGGRAYGYLDRAGQVVIAPQFEAAGRFSDGVAPVRLNGLWGYADTTGRLVVPGRFERADAFSEGRGRVRLDGRYGFVDARGHFVVPPEYDDAYSFQDGLAAARREATRRRVLRLFWLRVPNVPRWGFFDTTGTWAIPPRYLSARPFSEGRMPQAEQSLFGRTRYGFVDTAGAWAIPPRYRSVRGFTEGLALVRDEDRWAYLDRDGATIFALDADLAFPFSGGRARFAAGDRYGFVDRTGQVVVPPRFTHLFDLHEGLAAARDDAGRWGYVDGNGAWVIAPQYRRAEAFDRGLAPVTLAGGAAAYVDRAGRVVWQE